MTAVVLEKTATPAFSNAKQAYREFAPRSALADRVVCTWVNHAQPNPQPVLPDACIDLVWDGVMLSVAGPDTHPAVIEGDRTYVGIRFRPGSAPGFLGVSSDQFMDERISLSAFWGRDAVRLEERLAEQSASARGILEQALLQRLDAAPDVDPLVDGLVDLLARRTQLSRAIDRLEVSERTLRRRCTVAVGYGPKTLQRILRFRRALRLLRSQRPLAEIAHLAGYVDQAHLTNETQRLAGLPPAALAASSTLNISSNGCN
jgi:AraC-like DNA-binding protein